MSTARFRIALGVILLVAVAAGMAQAQEFRGRVQGIVTDATGAIVPGVGVVLRNDNTGVESSRTTNKDGWYLFDYVDPGTYTVTASVNGFKTDIRKGVRVQQRADLTVDFKLEVGSLVETVSVTEAPLGLQFTTATRDLTVEQQMVKELPSATRNPFQLATLDPMTVNRGSTVGDAALPPPHRERDGHRRPHEGQERGAASTASPLTDGRRSWATTRRSTPSPSTRCAERHRRRVRPQRGRRHHHVR